MNVLFLTHRLPYAPNRGDRARAHFLLRMLSQRASVDLISLVHDKEEAAHADSLRSVASSVHVAPIPYRLNMVKSALALPSDRPTTHSMLDSPQLASALATVTARRKPDVVLAYCSGMARLALAPPLRSVPFVLDMIDVDSAKWEALARVSSPPMSWIYKREAKVLRRFEACAARAAFANTVVTPQERDTLRSIAPDARVEVVPIGVDASFLRRPDDAPASQGVVFCGVMNYQPNEHAAVLLARDIWPLVRSHVPNATLTIVGSNPTRAVQELADLAKGIVVTGAVPDVRPYLWSAAIAAAPIVTARGIQNKVFEAVAAGLPTVVTPNIFASLPSAITPACVQASGAADLAEAIVALLRLSPAERRAMLDRANVRSLAWEHQLAPMERLLRDAASGRAPAAVDAAADTPIA